MKSFSLHQQKWVTNPKTGIWITIIIVAQFLLTPIIINYINSKFGIVASTYYSYYYSISSYILIGLGVYILHINKIRVFSDYLSIGAIALGCFLSPAGQGEIGSYYEIVMISMGLLFLLYLALHRETLVFPEPKFIFSGTLWSIGAVIVLALIPALVSKLPPLSIIGFQNTLLSSFIFQFSFVSVVEESLFRGVIYGFLVMNGIKESNAFLVQALLFWLIHYPQIENPPLFFLFIPALALCTTLIMRKYKIIFFPILTHLLINVFTSFLAAVLQKFMVGIF